MAIVTLKIGGREYVLSCDDGQEEHLRFLADDVDDRIRDLAARMGGGVNEVMGLLLSALTATDELIESKKENEKLSAKAQNFAALQAQGEEAEPVYTESAVANTLEEIAERIEGIAKRIEMR